MSAQLASLQDALEERKVIDKAKSILMNHQQVSEEQAWQLLRKMAMDKNQRMVDIARALLTVKSLMQDSDCTTGGQCLPYLGAPRHLVRVEPAKTASVILASELHSLIQTI